MYENNPGAVKIDLLPRPCGRNVWVINPAPRTRVSRPLPGWGEVCHDAEVLLCAE